MKATLRLFFPILLGVSAIAAAPTGSSGFLPESIKLTYEVRLYETELGNLVTQLNRNGDTYEVQAETRAEGLAAILLGGTLREECRFSVSDSLEVKPRNYSIEKEGSDAYSHTARFVWDDNHILDVL